MSSKKVEWGTVLFGFVVATAAVWVLNILTLGGYRSNGEPYENWFAMIGFIHIVVWALVAWLLHRDYEPKPGGKMVSVPAPLKQDAPHDTSMTGTDPGAEPGPPAYKGDATRGFRLPPSEPEPPDRTT